MFENAKIAENLSGIQIRPTLLYFFVKIEGLKKNFFYFRSPNSFDFAKITTVESIPKFKN